MKTVFFFLLSFVWFTGSLGMMGANQPEMAAAMFLAHAYALMVVMSEERKP